MKKGKKILSLLVALVMILGAFAPTAALAASVSTDSNAVTETVTLHKLLMTPAELSAWDPASVTEDKYDGTQNTATLGQNTGKTLTEIPNVYFALKFAKDYSDPALAGKYVLAGADKLTPASPLQGTDDVNLAVGGLTTTSGIVFNTAELKGKFEIDEIASLTTYVGDKQETLAGSKAVPVEITLPLVNSDGTVLNAHVYPKNTETKPQIDKNFAKDNGLTSVIDPNTNKDVGADVANYEAEKATVTTDIGKVIPYEVKTVLEAGTQYAKLVWKDTMTNGLTFTQGSIKIAGLDLQAGTDYTLKEDDRGFTLVFTQAGLDKVTAVTKPGQEGGANVELLITYSATVNGTAVVDNPEKNNITIEYGHTPYQDKEPTPVTPVDKKLNVTKTWANGQPLDKNLQVTYTLRNAGAAVASVTLDGNMTNNVFDLGNGITFTVTGAYSGTFDGLDQAGSWTIEERVAGYTETIDGTTPGQAKITNTIDSNNPTPISPTEPKVVVGGRKFVKTDGQGTRLAGAKFLVKNEAGSFLASKSDDQITAEQQAVVDAKAALDAAVTAYNGLTAEEQAGQPGIDAKALVASTQAAYEAALKKASIKYEWVADQNAGNVVVLASDDQGQFQIQGLAYGKYNLVEIEAPTGFAKIADVPFEIKEGSFSANSGTIDYVADSAEKDAQEVINKKVTIPQTGGIGTAIFTVAGLAIMGGAAVAMKRNKDEDEE